MVIIMLKSAKNIRQFIFRGEGTSKLLTNRWKYGDMSRNFGIQASQSFLNEEKSNEIFSSVSLYQMNHRHFHRQPTKQFMLLGEISRPNLLHHIAVPLLKLYIYLRVDKNFRANDFLQGAKQAIQFISNNLVNKNVTALKDITTPECFDELIKNTERLNEEERTLMEFKDTWMSWIRIERITFELADNRSENEGLILKIFVTNLSINPIISNETREHFQLKEYCAEFKRIYVEKQRSPWIVSGMNICYSEV